MNEELEKQLEILMERQGIPDCIHRERTIPAG
jgi:hypothetical protein